jgi:hypothetical membrane protein
MYAPSLRFIFGFAIDIKYGIGLGRTDKANVRVIVSAAFVAVTVNVCATEACVGVPEMIPVLVLNESPGMDEIAGEIEYVATAPPVEEIV